MPCDVPAYVRLWKHMKDDLGSVLSVALIKEPTAVQAWARTGVLGRVQYVTPLAFQDSLRSMAISVHQQKPTTELKQLSQQGVARFMGSCNVVRVFGVGKKQEVTPRAKQLKRPASSHGAETPSAKRPAASRDVGEDEIVTLGLGDLTYRLRPQTEVSAEVEGFVRLCADQSSVWQECLRQDSFELAMKNVYAMVDVIAQRCVGELKKNMTFGYVRKSIVRKIALALLAHSDL